MAWIPTSSRNFDNKQVVWPSLYQPPCYGFNGPSACTSSTCSHNPLIEPTPPIQRWYSFFCSNSTRTFEKYENWKNFYSASSPEFYPSAKRQQLQSNTYGYDQHNYWYSMDSPQRKTLWPKDFSFYEKSIFDEYKLDPSDLDFYKELEAEYLQMAASDKKTSVQLTESKHWEDVEIRENYQNSFILLPSVNSAFESKKNSSNKNPNNANSIRDYSAETAKDALSKYFKEHSRSSKKDSMKLKCARNNVKSQESFTCLICLHRCKTKNDLEKHIKNKILSPYECLICGLSFTWKYSLQRHQAIHSSQILYTCKGCNKPFSQLNQLTKHYENCNYKIYRF